MKILHYFFVVLSIVVSGCATYNESLHTQTENLSLVINEITPTNKPVHGTVLVLFPSDVEIQKNYIGRNFNLSKLKKEQVNFLTTLSKNNFQFFADAIQKRGIFDSVTLERHNGSPASFPKGNYDYMFFLDVDGWFLIGRNNPRGLPIMIENSKLVGTPRILAFLDLLEEAAKSLCNN